MTGKCTDERRAAQIVSVSPRSRLPSLVGVRQRRHRQQHHEHHHLHSRNKLKCSLIFGKCTNFTVWPGERESLSRGFQLNKVNGVNRIYADTLYSTACTGRWNLHFSIPIPLAYQVHFRALLYKPALTYFYQCCQLCVLNVRIVLFFFKLLLGQYSHRESYLYMKLNIRI